MRVSDVTLSHILNDSRSRPGSVSPADDPEALPHIPVGNAPARGTAIPSVAGGPPRWPSTARQYRDTDPDVAWQPVGPKPLTSAHLRARCPPLSAEGIEDLLARAATGEGSMLEMMHDRFAAKSIASGLITADAEDALDIRVLSMAEQALRDQSTNVVENH